MCEDVATRRTLVGAQQWNQFGGGNVSRRQAEDGSGRAAQGFPVVGADGAFGEEDSGGAEGFGGAEDGAEVAGVLKAGGDY